MKQRKDGDKMYCNNCGHKNEEKTSFCVECGSRLETLHEKDTQQKIYCGVCGNEVENGNMYCEKCGTGLKKKKHSGKKVCITLISVIMVMALACSAVFGYNMFSNPMLKIRNAAQNTLKAKNAEFEITMDTDYDDIEINGEIELDLDKEYFCLHLMFSDEYDEGEGWMRYEDSHMKVYTKELGEDIEIEDVPDELEENVEKLFDVLNGKNSSIESEEILKTIFPNMDEVNQYLHTEKFEKVCKKIAKKLAAKENMEKILGYEKSKYNSETIYSFAPNLYELVLFVIDNSEELFTRNAYSDIRDFREQMLEADSNDYPRLNMSLSVEGKYLTGYEIESEDFNMDVRLKNINKTSVDFPNR